MSCPELTREAFPSLPNGCVCGPYCGRVLFEVRCSRFNVGSILPRDTFTSLQSVNTDIHLSIVSSHLSDIDVNAFNGIETKIKSLSLAHNNLARVPAVLGKLSNLEKLMIEGNPIRTLSYSDFSAFAHVLTTLTVGLSHMTTYPRAIDSLPTMWDLSLKDVPFELSDMSIFQGNRVISTLMLIYTPGFQGHILPPSIVNLSGLRSVYVYGSKIPCDCSLKYLQHWDVSKVRILSPCTTGIYKVLDYIKGDLQHC